MAAVHMTMSLRYRCPPGTGTPKELIAMLMAVNIAVNVIILIGMAAWDVFSMIFSFWNGPMAVPYNG